MEGGLVLPRLCAYSMRKSKGVLIEPVHFKGNTWFPVSMVKSFLPSALETGASGSMGKGSKMVKCVVI